MDAKMLLEQLLESGRKIAETGIQQSSELTERGTELAKQGLEFAKDKLDLPEAGPERDQMLKNLGIGAAAGGLLALLVGTKSGRKVFAPAAKLGSLAALGGLGYAVYSQWQKSQGNEVQGQAIANLPPSEANQRCLAIVKSMIAAAKADGTIDANEKAIIFSKIEASDLNDEATKTLLAEINKPLNVTEVAALADTREAAVEIYLASLLVVREENEAEQNYLRQLTSALKLEPGLVANLKSEAFGSA